MYIRSSSVYKPEPQQHPLFQIWSKVANLYKPKRKPDGQFSAKEVGISSDMPSDIRYQRSAYQISDIRYAISRSWIFSFRHESDWLLWIKYWFPRED